MAVTYRTLRIPADSAFEINTAGRNTQGGEGAVDGRSGVPFDDTNSTAFVSITDKAGGEVLSQTPTTMVWTAATGLLPARWAYVVPATVCVTGAGNWTATVVIHGPTGLNDTKFATEEYTLTESD